jgi:protein-L-isoaspartate(D-aspartate) O-methyltransferase
MRPSFSSNDQMVDYLVEQGRIKSSRVEKAFREVDRADFVCEDFSSSAYADKPLPLNGETVSAPHMVAMVTELLELKGSEKVLEIGSGSGYQAAILGELAEEVVGVEINKELAEESQEKVPANVEIRVGNGLKEVTGKYDRILFSCATEDFEEAEKAIEKDGVIVGPVKEGNRQILKKWKDGETSSHGSVRYVEMQG